MDEPIENMYFNWLCAKVLDNTFEICTLLIVLHNTEFVWVVPFDRNRAEDGIELRQDFLRETNTEPDDIWENEPCSVLEFLIAFARRAQFQTDISVKDWFWMFMENLGLDEFRRQSDPDISVIENILQTFIWRTYDSRGFGGLFPLHYTENDQRDVEIFYQFCEYVDEHNLV